MTPCADCLSDGHWSSGSLLGMVYLMPSLDRCSKLLMVFLPAASYALCHHTI